MLDATKIIDFHMLGMCKTFNKNLSFFHEFICEQCLQKYTLHIKVIPGEAGFRSDFFQI